MTDQDFFEMMRRRQTTPRFQQLRAFLFAFAVSSMRANARATYSVATEPAP